MTRLVPASFFKRQVGIFLASLAVLLATESQAANYEIGDADIIERFKVETLFAYEQRGGERAWERPGVQLGVALGGSVELVGGAGYGTLRLPDGNRRHGATDAWIALKWRLLDENPDSGMPAIAIEPEWIHPTGSHRAGLSNERAAWALPVRVIKNFGDSRLTGQVSYGQNVGGSERELSYGVLYEYQLTADLSLGTEVLRDAALRHAPGQELRLHAGVRWNPIETVEVHALVGRLLDRVGNDHAKVARLSIEYLF